jgi:phosphomannomutase
MQIDAGIFKAYDIRGLYPNQIDKSIYRVIGLATGNYLGPKTAVVGRDMRISSPELAAAFIEGMLESGADVTDIGQVSTDALYFAVGKYGFDCGAMVTASHNPPQYNGLKMCKKDAVPLSAETDMAQILKLIQTDSFKPATQKGKLTQKEIIPDFIKHALTFIDIKTIKPFKIVIDAGNGMAGKLIPELFKYLPCQLVPMYFELDGRFPNHLASPIEPENIADLQKRLISEKADFGAAFDGDADRVFLLDENANALGGDMVTAMVAQSLLAKNPGSSIIYNLICSKAVPELVKASGGIPIRTRVGHAIIKPIMKEKNAIFGGEHSGHFYFRDNWFADSGLIAFLVCLELMSKSKSKLSELVASFDKYVRSGEINSKVNDIPAKLKELVAAYPKAKVDDIDGVTIDCDDFWFNVRPSNTEPLLRLNLEADSRELMMAKTKEVLAIIRS